MKYFLLVLAFCCFVAHSYGQLDDKHPLGQPFLFCDINQKFSEGHGTVESYNIAFKNMGLVDQELIPLEGVGSSVYWWSDADKHRRSSGFQWDYCFTIFSTTQNRTYIDYHNQITMITVTKGSLLLAGYDREGLKCRIIDDKDSAICESAPGTETWTKVISAGESYIHNSSVPHSVTFLTPYVLRTVCFMNV